MRRAEAVGTFLLATVVLAVLLALRPFGRELALRLYLLALTGIVLAAAAAAANAAVPRAGRSSFLAALRRRPPAPGRPPQLERVERAVALGQANAYDFHARLRPLLREIAAARLARARGVELDSPAGRAALGEDAWALLRPDREPPDERHSRGLDERRLRELLTTLERL